MILWLVLGMGHLRLAWVLLDRDWSSVVKIGALMAAAAITLFAFMGVLFLDATALLVAGAAYRARIRGDPCRGPQPFPALPQVLAGAASLLDLFRELDS